MGPVLVSELASFLPACPLRPSGAPSPCLWAGQQRGGEAGAEWATPGRSLSRAPQCSPVQGPTAFQGMGRWVLPRLCLEASRSRNRELAQSPGHPPHLAESCTGVRECGAQLGCVMSLQHAWAEGKLPAGRNRLLLSLLLPDFTPRGRQELVGSAGSLQGAL